MANELFLGVYPGHNANAAVVSEEGDVLFALEEARLSRIKDQPGIPFRVLAEIKQRFGTDFTRVTVRDPKYLRPLRDIDFSLRSIAKKLAPPNWKNISDGYWRALTKGRLVEAASQNQAPWFIQNKSKLFNVGHHTAHASSAYFCSGFTTGPVMTLDGQGDDRYACTFFWGQNSKLQPLNKLYYNEAPLGYNFQIVTTMLGFHGGRHPGKITGLAAYGEANEACLERLSKFLDNNWRKTASGNMMNYPSFLLFTKEGKKLLKKTRENEFKNFSLHQIAWAIQKLTERRTLSLIKKNLGPPPYPSLALAGGVFGNVKLNQHIKELGVRKIFVQPAMGDDGLSLGAALYLAAQRGSAFPKMLKSVFHGPSYSIKEMEEAISKAGLSFIKPDNMPEKIANLLADGFVVTRYDGALEFGPRALGNRSILFNTEDKTVNDWLNKRLNRTEFMPFAPVTLIEDAHKCYENLYGAIHAAKFMTITFPCTDWMKRTSPAVVHVDGTARPQLIEEKDNPDYYQILKEYKKLTGIPSLINTSFNIHEEPIVNSPDDAIRAFQRGNLDYLAMGPFILKNPDIKHF